MTNRSLRGWFVVAMALCLIFISACGGSDNEAQSPVTKPPTTTPVPPNTDANKPEETKPDPEPAPETTPPDEHDPIRDIVDSMTVEQKVGQIVLFGVTGTEMNEQIRQWIAVNRVGGFIFFKPNIQNSEQTWKLVSAMKHLNTNEGNKLPLFLSIDQEGGKVSRTPKDVRSFPTSQAVGRTKDGKFAYQVGEALGQTLNTYGFNVDFAPVLDVNSNPKNPVIGSRSFGSTADLVASMGIQEMKGIRSQNVIPVVKHFPGHGDTSVDSHKDLPVVGHDMKRLRSLELVPFAKAIQEGADAVMVAHLLMKQLDPDLPASLSRAVIHDLLREELGFQGVIFTDDMTMEAITKTMPIGQAAVKAVNAGADVVLVGHDPEKQQNVLDALISAVEDGTISEETINDSVYRIAKLKITAELKDKAAPKPDIAGLNKDIDAVLSKYFKL